MYQLTMYQLTTYQLTMYQLTMYQLTMYQLTMYQLTPRNVLTLDRSAGAFLLSLNRRIKEGPADFVNK